MEHPSADELVARLKGGDSEAFGELYARHRGRVFRFAVKLIQDTDLAEDIVQETFLKMQKAIHRLDQNQSLASWLFAIARNEVYSHFRKTRRDGQVDPEDIWVDGTPAETTIRAETTEIVQYFIGRLKPEYREVLLLREYEQLSYDEIAGVTGHSVGIVKSRLFKARKALVQKLKPYFGEEE